MNELSKLRGIYALDWRLKNDFVDGYLSYFDKRLKKVVFNFFFQAEDGIRDVHVTGVQTCALPISVLHLGDDWIGFRRFGRESTSQQRDARPGKAGRGQQAAARDAIGKPFCRHGAPSLNRWEREYKIGRASCRERGVGVLVTTIVRE